MKNSLEMRLLITYFVCLSAQNKTLKVETANGRWIKNFYLPNSVPDFVKDGCIITFSSKAVFDSTVHYQGKTYAVKQDKKQVHIFQ